MAVNILLKRSATPSKRPVGGSMAYGELNLNYDASTGGLYYKNNNGDVVKVGPCQVSSTAPNSTPGGSAGNSAGEFWFDTSTDTLKVYDGADWVETGGAVQGVTGTAPITVDNTDPLNPVIGVDAASTSAPGVVQLNDTTSSTSTTEALTAAQGKSLQDQIDALVVSSNLTLAGTLDASTGNLVTVTTEGAAQGFAIGDPLPSASAGNAEYFVIATVGAASYTPPGGSAVEVHIGDWFLSSGTAWELLDVGFQAPYASTTTPGVIQLATDSEVQAGVETTHAVTSSGLQSKVSDSVSTTSSTTLASSTAVKAAYDAGIQGQTNAAAALTAANNAQNTADQAILDAAAAQDTANSALPMAGGIMTGNLYLEGAGVGIGFADTSFVEAISDSTSTTSSTTAASSTAVKAAKDAADAAQAVADGALPKAGGEMTGNIVLTNGALITNDNTANLELVADFGMSFLLQSTNFSGQIDALTLNIAANSSDADALSIYTPGTATLDFGNTNLVTTNGLQVNGDAGTAGYILQSNGAGAAPTWVSQSEGDVTGVSGTAPITVDNTDPQNPIVGIDAASTSAPGAVQLNDTVTSTSTTEAATANAVKLAYDTAVAAAAAGNVNGITSDTVIFVNSTDGNDSTGQRGTTKPFLTITAALAAAQENDTIFLSPGTFTENATLTKGVNLVGTLTDQALGAGTKILGNFVVNATASMTKNWAIRDVYFISPNSTPAFSITANSFGAGGIGSVTNCDFTQATSSDPTQYAVVTSGTWTRSVYFRECTFDGNFHHNAGTAAGASGYVVVDRLLGVGNSAFYNRVTTGTVEFRNPSNSLASVFQTGGVCLINGASAGITPSGAGLNSVFGSASFSYKGSAASAGTGTVYFSGECQGTGKVEIGANLIYGYTGLIMDPAGLTINVAAIPYTTAVPAAANAQTLSQQRPRLDLLKTTSVVTAANQLATVVDSANGAVYTVAALDAGTY